MAHNHLLRLLQDGSPDTGFANPRQNQRDFLQQFIVSILLGLGSFATFCILRPKWPQFYYARKIRRRISSVLPDLPPSMFGWITTLYSVTDQTVLATAGLDAYVFLAFFKMAIKFCFVTGLLAAVILAPIHGHFGHDSLFFNRTTTATYPVQTILSYSGNKKTPHIDTDQTYLWTHVVFVYVFTAIAYYFLLDTTQEVVHVRQDYLGNQSTVTDRTFKLSGIPEELRSEGTLKEYIERLKIGKVAKLTICRDWRDLDHLVEQRNVTLRMLEEALTVYRMQPRLQRNLETLPAVQPDPPYPVPGMRDDEQTQPLLDGDAPQPHNPRRPQFSLRRGWFQLRAKKVDAIDYLTVKLQNLDDKITEARRREYVPIPLAFVTMDSVPAAQLAVQALLDPMPGALIARQAPAPSDVIWPSTYLSRRSRFIRQWSISIFVTLLSIFWLIPVTALAVLWNLEEIKKYWPALGDILEQNEVVKSAVQTFLPTLVFTLLNVATPYLYEWLSTKQGFISKADVELSVISKNFFFTFFNLFLVFTFSGAAVTFKSIWDSLRDAIGDTRTIAYLLARSLEELGPFYVNLIMLQGLAVFPLRLLQVGSVLLYPIEKYGAKTPRDYQELTQPPVFQYGFFLPQPILIFIICIVYSVLPGGVLLLFFGLLYFVFGYFTYKYQLLYAMDHQRHSTGRAWPMIVYRVILGLIVFQVAMAGTLALRRAYVRGALILPLLAFTLWTLIYYNREYLPANLRIALKSIRMVHSDDAHDAGVDHTVDEEREEGLEFINPSLVSPLESPRIAGRLHDGVGENGGVDSL